ncbi:MAG: FAD-dependent oxidoreductase [Ignavibacteria bacterium]|jgi:NADPH-dependent glutamate synthase beta subunit-like oxidoreductase
MIRCSINGINVEVIEGTTILEAARSADIYIPTVCSHPDLPPFHSLELSDFIFQGENKFVNDPDTKIESITGCGICIVSVEGKDKPVPSCKTEVTNGMTISTETEEIRKQRQKKLIPILSTHPHSCLTCSQREGCIPLTDVCPGNVPAEERCCELLGNCELEKVVDYVGIAPETPRYVFKDLPKITSDPLFIRDFNLCISCGRCVRMCQHVKGVYALGGVINNNKLIIGTVNGPMLDEAECKFCGSCVEVCPTGALKDKDRARLKEFSDYLPCRAACPGEVNIPLYLRLVSKGKTQEAAEVIASRLTFPSVLGKICFHPCEAECKRNETSEVILGNSEPVNIRMIKDYAMSNSELSPLVLPEKKSGKTVAVIGGGPAGLTSAYFLALKGHSVTVYEKEDKLGGMLRYGIPKYRLPEEILNKDINRILESGIEVKTNVSIGKEITSDSIKSNGTDAIFVSTGLSKSRTIPFANSELSNVSNGIEFLKQVAKNEIAPDHFESKSVLVIGGGNVATDAARTVVRLKAEKVTIVCLEQKDEMPAYETEIKEAEEEGINILNGWGIESTINTNDFVQVKLKKCTRVFDDAGKFSPEYDESVTENISAQEVIICIGQESGDELKTDEILNSIFSNGFIKVNKETLETGINGIFAGGDIVSGPTSVIDAVGFGRKAARSIDKYLGGDGIIDIEEPYEDNEMFIGREKDYSSFKREQTEYINAEVRKNNFNSFEITYNEDSAVKEAARCLKCNLRFTIAHNPLPPEKFIKVSAESIEKVPMEAGVIQLLDENKEVYNIRGTENMNKTMLEFLADNDKAKYFIYESDPMYTKRESELLQQYLQKHGKLPDSGDDIDDLF